MMFLLSLGATVLPFIIFASFALAAHGRRQEARWAREDELQWMNADKDAYWNGHFPDDAV